ncbi:E3 ubiquitin-protein ligase RMA1H1-like [Silene latifolia]|uniref:E3 ubiquitin-protein ligase RMA1H1-like n=1 Tax=Silene latifolia TaxID=37657 RepID=UPI003D76B235
MELERQFDQSQKSIPSKDSAIDHLNGCFECNICLDAANDPVVTLCGHLYCWPCIYKWFYIQSSSLPSDEYPQCPVCKAEISHTTVIPLYGRGQFPSIPEDEPKSTFPDTVIPPRPPACGTRALLNAASQPEHQLRPYRHNPYQARLHNSPEEVVSSSSLINPTSDTMANVFQPVVGLFGEMVYARVFGDSQSLDTYPNPYHRLGNSSPRSRRQEMQVDKSLSRISLFLLCCFLLCLFLF